MEEKDTIEISAGELKKLKRSILVTQIFSCITTVLLIGIIVGAFLFVKSMMPKVEQVAASIEPIQKAAAQLSTVDLKGALDDLHGINESMSKVDWDELSRQVGQLDVDSMNRTLQGIDVEQLEKALENLNGIIDAFKKLPFFGN